MKMLKATAIFMAILVALIILPPSYFLGVNSVVKGQNTPPATGPGSLSDPFIMPEIKVSGSQQVSDNLRFAQFTAMTTAFASFFTLPGSIQVGTWSDPSALENIQVPAQPYVCTKPGNYTLSAKLDTSTALSFKDSKPLYTSGSKITVQGEVEAFSSTCKGVNLTCSEQAVQVCNVDRIPFGHKLEYADCPQGFVQKYAEGEKTHRSILGTMLFFASMVLAIYSFGGWAFLGIGAKTAAILSTAAASGSTIVSQVNAAAGDDEPCFNVCARDYTSNDPGNPFCHRGGPVIGSKIVEYQCQQASCGPARNKKVSIDVKSNTGSRIQRADTSTDSTGIFDFTFSAPPQDGDFFVFVKVPK